MSPVSVAILAFGMSVDAFIASIGRGAAAGRPGWGRALRIGAVFGLVEAVTPLIGWALGIAASRFVMAFDHWIAFALLAGVGVRMALHALGRGDDPVPQGSGTGWALVATAVGTSIDAMAVGVSLAFLDVNIIVIALSIGLATMTMSTTGIMAGRFLGARFGRIAEVVGGVALVGLGCFILFEHLAA